MAEPASSNVHRLPVAPRPGAFVRPVSLSHRGETQFFHNTRDLAVALAEEERRRDDEQADLDQVLRERAWDVAGPVAQLHATIALHPVAWLVGLGFVALIVRALGIELPGIGR